MTTKQFKPGDVVTAKMGGPKMTVEVVRVKSSGSGDLVHCSWFDQMFVLHRDAFDPVALKPAPAR